MNPKKKLRKEADKLWYRKYLKDQCEVCGKTEILQAHHFYYRLSYPHCRYLEENHITLCRACHFLLHHRDPKTIEEEIIKKRGKKWFDDLTQKSKERLISFQTIKWYNNNVARLQCQKENSRKK